MESNCITETTYESESSEPHIRSSLLGIWHWEKEPPEYLALRVSGLVYRGSTGLGEMETPLLKGTHRISCALGPRAKQRLYRNLGQTCLWFLEDVLEKQGVSVAHSGGRILEAKVLGIIISNHQHVFL